MCMFFCVNVCACFSGCFLCMCVSVPLSMCTMIFAIDMHVLPKLKHKKQPHRGTFYDIQSPVFTLNPDKAFDSANIVRKPEFHRVNIILMIHIKVNRLNT